MLSRLKGIETRSIIWRVNCRGACLALDMLSRLKGMETCYYDSLHNSHLILWICFPVWREWKQSSVAGAGGGAVHVFGYAFPFEGNGNTNTNIWIIGVCHTLDMLSRLKGIETYLEMLAGDVFINFLWICFPVWREWKRESESFPSSCHKETLDMLSRLKGIETIADGDTRVEVPMDGFGYAFPFEGNWNSKPPQSLSSDIPFGYAFPFEGNWNSAILQFSG